MTWNNPHTRQAEADDRPTTLPGFTPRTPTERIYYDLAEAMVRSMAAIDKVRDMAMLPAGAAFDPKLRGLAVQAGNHQGFKDCLTEVLAHETYIGFLAADRRHAAEHAVPGWSMMRNMIGGNTTADDAATNDILIQEQNKARARRLGRMTGPGQAKVTEELTGAGSLFERNSGPQAAGAVIPDPDVEEEVTALGKSAWEKLVDVGKLAAAPMVTFAAKLAARSVNPKHVAGFLTASFREFEAGRTIAAARHDYRKFRMDVRSPPVLDDFVMTMRSTTKVLPQDLLGLRHDDMLMHQANLFDLCGRILHETDWHDAATVGQVSELATTLSRSAQELEAAARDFHAHVQVAGSACSDLNAIYNDHGKTPAMIDDILPAIQRYGDATTAITKIGKSLHDLLNSNKAVSRAILDTVSLDHAHARILPDAQRGTVMAAFRERLDAHRAAMPTNDPSQATPVPRLH